MCSERIISIHLQLIYKETTLKSQKAEETSYV